MASVSNCLLVVVPAPCRYLRKDGFCEIQESKPSFCREFPQGQGTITLPSACPYLDRSRGHIALEDLQELTVADLVDMLAKRATVRPAEEANDGPDPGN